MPPTEFSRVVSIEPWPTDGITVDLVAASAECRLLKERFDLVDLGSLSASCRIEQVDADLVVSGMIEAELVQSCVVTLRPIASTLRVPLQRHFRRRSVHDKLASVHDKLATAGEDGVISTDAIDVEILDGDEIDLGEVIAEELCLALPPYPRADDADQVLIELQETSRSAASGPPANPFAKLRSH